jgi:hypothetical protein
MKNIFVVLLYIIFNIQSLSQTFPNKVTTSLSIGGSFASEANYAAADFENRYTKFISYTPDLSGKLGISYESLTNIYNLNLGLVLDVGYFSASTEKFNFRFGNGKATQKLIPVILSLKLEGNNELNPLLKFGLGIGNKKISEVFENYSIANVTVEKWFFIISGGTGLSYKINESFKCAIIFDVIILDGKLSKENEYGYVTGLVGLQASTYFGLQFSYTL